MKSLRQQPTVLKETRMMRPDLDTLACVNPACQRFRRPGGANLPVRDDKGALLGHVTDYGWQPVH